MAENKNKGRLLPLTNNTGYREIIEAVREKDMPKKRKFRRGKEMITRGFYLPKDLFDRVDSYAKMRGGLSRNAAAEELLEISLQGLESFEEGEKSKSIRKTLEKIQNKPL